MTNQPDAAPDDPNLTFDPEADTPVTAGEEDFAGDESGPNKTVDPSRTPGTTDGEVDATIGEVDATIGEVDTAIDAADVTVDEVDATIRDAKTQATSQGHRSEGKPIPPTPVVAPGGGFDATIDPMLTVDPLASYDPEKVELLATIDAPEDPSSGSIDALGETTAGTTRGFGSRRTLAGQATLDDEQLSRVQEACHVFESAWDSGEKEPAVEEYVPSDVEPSLRQTIVHQLLLLDIDRRKKRNMSLQADAYLSRLPDCSKAVESAFSKRKSASLPRGYGSAAVASGVSKSRADLTPAHANDSLTRYPPTKFHARGGLGAVFQAQDKELNRLVALKEILPDHAANERLQEKFIFEAEITGALEHPGIVPVYGLGRYEDDQPYYAMRFIRGESFRDAIEQFHKDNDLSADLYYGRDFRSLLRRLVDACNAMHYAHESGVVHRDIKPDNIMIGGYGETLVVDWGLAKLFDSSEKPQGSGIKTTRISIRATGSGRNTSEGSAVGTPMYMSPEQANGKHDRLDGRTDVYSLGAVLFNIVTGKYPVEGKTARDIITNVQHGKLRTPISIVPCAPKAIASICRKAMAVNPSDRYQTAVELAQDIERWMGDEIVQAHVGHETLTERAGRLIRRHRSWTISAAVTLAVITIVAFASAVLINNAKNREALARKDAVARYRTSRDSIEKFLVESADTLKYFPKTAAVRTRLLQIAIEDYEKLTLNSSSDPELEIERGRAMVELGDLMRRQENYDGAMNHYDSAFEVFNDNAKDREHGRRARVEKANLHTKKAFAYLGVNQMEDAKVGFQNAIDELDDLANDSDDMTARQLRAFALSRFGELYWINGDNERAQERIKEALDEYNKLKSNLSDAQQLAMGNANELLGRVYASQGMHRQAVSHFDNAIDVLTALVEKKEDHPGFLRALAAAQISKASSLRDQGAVQQEFAMLNSAMNSYDALCLALPGVPDHQENLAIGQIDLGLAHYESGDNLQATPLLEAARKELTELTEDYIKVPRFRERLAACEDVLGQVLLDTAVDPTVAEAMLDNAVSRYEGLYQESVRRYQQSRGAADLDMAVRYSEVIAIARSHKARSLQRLEKTSEAAVEFDHSVKSLEPLIDRDALPRYINALAHVQYRYGLMLNADGKAEAKQQFGEALRLWTVVAGKDIASYTHDLAWMLATCPDAAVRNPVAALKYASEAVGLASENPRYLSTQALATVLNGNAKGALQMLEKTKELHGDWVDRDYFVLAIAQHRQGQIKEAQTSMKLGMDWMAAQRPFNEDSRRLAIMANAELQSEAK